MSGLNHNVPRGLVTAANRRFFPGVLAMLRSAARHHPDIPRWCYVGPDEVAEARELFGDLAEIITAPRAIAGIPAESQVFVPKLFAPTLPVDVIAYVDADAIFCRPAPELWQVEPGKVNVIKDGAPNVLESVPPPLRPQFAAVYADFCKLPCFNGGVWAMRTAEFRDLPERYEEAIAKVRFDSYHPVLDQPVLNAMWQPNVNWLPIQFNVNNLFDHAIPADARIVHFTGGKCKPWDDRYPRHEPQYYWWLRHGLNEQRALRLIAAKARVWIITPKRLIGRQYRRWQEKQAAAR